MNDSILGKKPQFSGHETFPLRQLWLKKAFDAVENRPVEPIDPQADEQLHRVGRIGGGRREYRQAQAEEGEGVGQHANLGVERLESDGPFDFGQGAQLRNGGRYIRHSRSVTEQGCRRVTMRKPFSEAGR